MQWVASKTASISIYPNDTTESRPHLLYSLSDGSFFGTQKGVTTTNGEKRTLSNQVDCDESAKERKLSRFVACWGKENFLSSGAK